MDNVFLKKNTGFTLIEVLVATALFVMAMTIIAGAVSSMMASQARARSVRVAIDNISTSLEYMTRELRSGNTYHCNVLVGSVAIPQDCADGATSISFYNKESVRVEYRFVPDAGFIARESFFPSVSFLKLTYPTEVWITNFQIRVVGAENESDDVQPLVTIRIAGRTTAANQAIPFIVQTSVSQRDR